MTKTLTFNQALEASQGCGQRHLLLGNGFSISRFPLFKYKSLLKQSRFPGDSKLPCVFQSQDTTDFELVMRRLDETRDLLSVYLPSQSDSISETNDREKEVLRKTLISAITNNHPKRPDEISRKEYGHCRKFLQYFLGDSSRSSAGDPTTTGDSGRVFTLNYDLLLYWTLMDEMPMGNDGFWNDSQSRLLWHGENQNVHYLHGALHLFEKDDTVEKIKYAKQTLREQIKGRIQSGRFPLFVTEGDSSHKRKKIEACPYLDHSYQSFSDVVGKKESVLFVFGHSLSDQDSHILEQMINGSFRHVFVGLFNGAGGDADIVRSRAEKLKQQRKNSPLCVQYYDAESANIWNKQHQS